MKKKVSLIINSCYECPFRITEFIDSEDYCNYIGEYIYYETLDNKLIDERCTFEDTITSKENLNND